MLRRHGPVALLAVLAYLPALLAAPGRMPADSKLYLYLDPASFLVDAASSFDPGQFAGWVPHQHISYLWPAGPWFLAFETAGVADWIAHRLWIGTLMLAAGLGVRWTARMLGLGATACITAALVYQVSVYVLPYVSRTSVMLLPWAGLGWIVGFTIRATARRGWGDPAAIALIVLTVGAVNATALAMIVPAPVLWLAHEAWRRTIGWRDALLVAARVAILSTGVSLWWMTALVLQGRYGADVLPFSESLRDVSSTATSAEVWRGLGYWLFYVRDPYAATTTASLRYLSSTPAIVVSFLVPTVCLLGMVWVRWAHRRFAAALVVVGGVLAVGVHPIDDRSPLMRALAGSDDGGLALALRSSTRALPLLFLGLALAAGALVEAIPRPTHRRASAFVVAALVLVNLPGLWTGAFVDPALERDQDPPTAWIEAADALGRTDGRVLMVPGVEFGAYRWGYTVDQPVPGLTDTPLVTRDLLPLGSAPAMDLLFALDDRIQDGVAEARSLAPIARLLGADTIWSTNDVAFDRFRTARPEVVRDLVATAPGVGSLVGFGEPAVNVPTVPMVDERAIADPRVGDPFPPVELASIERAAGGADGVVRARTSTVFVSGSGAGLVDLAAAGLLDGDHVIRYTASTDGLVDDDATALLVTDSHRSQARHWRSSQDTRGLTEPGPYATGLVERPSSDQRLVVVENAPDRSYTYAEQRSTVQAIATSYGEPFAYLPERRPFRAIDGDPTTAWSVGEHGNPIGEALQLWHPPLDVDGEMRLRVPDPAGGRRITEIRVRFDDLSGRLIDEQLVVLGDEVLLGQTVPVPARTTTTTITITAVGGGEPFTAGAVAGVGFSEIDLGFDVGREVVRVPSDATTDLAPGTPLAFVFTRWRHDPLARWRSDPEPDLTRLFEVPGVRAFVPEVEVRLDARADDGDLAELFGWPVRASTRLTGSVWHTGAAAFDGDPATSWISAFGAAAGATLSIDDVGVPIAALSLTQPAGDFSRVRVIEVAVGDEVRTVALADLTVTDVAIDPPLPPGPVEIRLIDVETATTIDRRFGDEVELPAAISEISFVGAPRVDVAAGPVLDCIPLTEVGDTIVSATVSFEGWRERARRGEALTTRPCTDRVELGGDVLLTPVDHGYPLQLDRVVLDDRARQALGRVTPDVTVSVTGHRFQRTVSLSGCSDGCWLVLGEGYNVGWSARASASEPGQSELRWSELGSSELVDGGFNGWWLEPGTDTVVVTWGPQRTQVIALVLSLAAALGAIFVLIRGRQVVPGPPPHASLPVWAWERTTRATRAWPIVVVWPLAAILLAGPAWGLVGLAGGALASRFPKVPVAALTTAATVAVIGLATTYVERRDAPFPGGGWPGAFDSLHWIGMFAFAALAASALTDND